jgi:nicotinamide-nucleotide amidase
MAAVPTDGQLHEAAAAIGRLLLERRMKLSAAESCTGGWLSKVVTEVPGCSDWFDCSFVAYSYEAKESMLGLNRVTLETFGAVSRETVVEMVRGALSRSRANVAVAITGIAGPSGGTPGKPVGTVWLAWGRGHHPPVTEMVHLDGDRDAIRRQTVAVAFTGLQKILTAPSEAF